MTDDLGRLLAAVMKRTGTPARREVEAAARRDAVAGLRRSCGRARRRRAGSLAATGVLIAGTAVFLVLALPHGDRTPASTMGVSVSGPGAATRREAPAVPGRWWLSPTHSRVGEAAAAAAGLGRPPKWVRATRVRTQGVLAGGDTASFRDAVKNGLEMASYVAFSRPSKEDLGPGTALADGTAWDGARDAGFQSLYFLSRDGFGVWVGNHSSAPGGRPRSHDDQLAVARRFVAELRARGVLPSVPLPPPGGPAGTERRAARLIGVIATPAGVPLDATVPVVVPRRRLRWTVLVLNAGRERLEDVEVVVRWIRVDGRAAPEQRASTGPVPAGAAAAIDVAPPRTSARNASGVVHVDVSPYVGKRDLADNTADFPVTIAAP